MKRLDKIYNDYLILETLRTNSPISISKIASIRGLSRPTVDTAIEQMEKVGIIIQDGYAESDSGRRPTLWKLNKDSGYFIGIDIEVPKVRVVVLNMCKEMIFSVTQEISQFEPQIVITKLVEIITNFITVDLHCTIDKIKSISVGNPGDIDRQQGISIFVQNCNAWKNVPIVELLQNEFKCPVYLENIILFMANVERDKMANDKNNDFVYIALKTGVGAGVCINGELYSGYKGNAGHLGHLPLIPPLSSGGKRLEECAGTIMILNRMKEYNLIGDAEDITFLTTKHLDILTEKADTDDQKALSILEEMAEYWAYAIATVICHLDIPQFIIGGMLAYINLKSNKVGTYFLDTVEQNCINKYLFSKVPFFRLKFAEYIDYAAALGGAQYCYENFFQQIFKIEGKNIAINRKKSHNFSSKTN